MRPILFGDAMANGYPESELAILRSEISRLQGELALKQREVDTLHEFYRRIREFVKVFETMVP
jgi:hypothetical protein